MAKIGELKAAAEIARLVRLRGGQPTGNFDQDIALLIAQHGGKFTDSLERQIEQRALYAPGNLNGGSRDVR